MTETKELPVIDKLLNEAASASSLTVRKKIGEWRKRADAQDMKTDMSISRKLTLRDCAAELEQLLSQQASPPQEPGQ